MPRTMSLASPLISAQRGGQSSSTRAVSYLQSSLCPHHCSAPGPSLTCSARGSLKGWGVNTPADRRLTAGVWESIPGRWFHVAPPRSPGRSRPHTHPCELPPAHSPLRSAEPTASSSLPSLPTGSRLPPGPFSGDHGHRSGRFRGQVQVTWGWLTHWYDDSEGTCSWNVGW